MTEALIAAVLLLALLSAANLVLLFRRPGSNDRLVVLAEQAISLGRAEAETTRMQLAASERALASSLASLSTTMVRDQGDARALLETKLREMSEQAALRLG